MLLARKLQRGGIVPITSPLHPALIAMYTMDNISGATLFDESPNNHDLTITGAVTTTGIVGNALDFDGIDDKAATSYFSDIDINQGAISFWVKDPTGEENVFGVGSTSTTTDILVISYDNAGILNLFWNSSAAPFSWVKTTTAGTPSAWTNFIVQSDGSAWTIYVDNVLSGLSLQAGSNSGQWFSDIATQPDNFIIGGHERQSFSSYGDVLIDQMRFFNRPLDASERSLIYNGGSGS